MIGLECGAMIASHGAPDLRRPPEFFCRTLPRGRLLDRSTKHGRMRTVDALSEVLKALRLTTGIFLDAEFRAPWCVDSTPGDEDHRVLLPRAEQVSIFHVLTQGSCLVKLSDSRDALSLGHGDLIMFPRCDSHMLGSDVQMAPVPM